MTTAEINAYAASLQRLLNYLFGQDENNTKPKHQVKVNTDPHNDWDIEVDDWIYLRPCTRLVRAGISKKKVHVDVLEISTAHHIPGTYWEPDDWDIVEHGRFTPPDATRTVVNYITDSLINLHNENEAFKDMGEAMQRGPRNNTGEGS